MAEPQKVAMGRYIEQDMPFEEADQMDGDCMIQRPDGKIQLLGQDEEGKIHSYIQQDDWGFKPVKLEWEEAFNQLAEKMGIHYIAKAAIDLEGNTSMICIAYKGTFLEKGGAQSQTYFLKTEGSKIAQIIPIKGESNEPFYYLDSFTFLGDEKGVLMDNGRRVKEYNLMTGEEEATYEVKGDANKMLFKDGKLYISYEDPEHEQQMDVFDTATHELSRSIEFKQDKRYLQLCGGDQGIYAINKEGIWHLVEGGDIWEKVMSSEGVSLGLPTKQLSGAYFNKGTFITQLLSREGYFYKAYYYSKTTPSKPEKQLTAYMLTGNTAFKEAVVSYEIAHPEVSIHVVQGVGKEGTISKEDAIRSLSTEILSGKGPDLIVMDDLDLEAYQKKGVLVDLKELSGVQALIPEIQKAMVQEDGLYAVPLRFTTYALLGDEKLLDEASGAGNILEGLAKYQQEHPEERVMADLSAKALYKAAAPMMLYSGQAINEEQVSHILKVVKELTQTYESSEGAAAYEKTGIDELSSELTSYDGSKQIINGLARLQMVQVKREDDLLVASDVLKQAHQEGFKIMAQDGKAYFNPKGLVGISQSSKQKELAKEVVSFILDENIQGVETRDGMPTNEAACQRKLTPDLEHLFRFGVEDPTGLKLTASWENQMVVPVFKEEMKKVSFPVYQNHEVLDDMIIEAAQPYWKGEKSLEEVLENLMPKLSLKSKELNMD